MFEHLKATAAGALSPSAVALGVWLGAMGLFFAGLSRLSRRAGYQDARKQLRAQAAAGVVQTLKYLDDAADVDDEQGRRERVTTLLLPRWKLQLLKGQGQDADAYVVRQPMRAAWSDAWFMTQAASDEVDAKIAARFQLDAAKVAQARRDIAAATQQTLDDHVAQLLSSND